MPMSFSAAIAFPPRHAEGGDFRVLERQVGDALEILGVFRVREGIAPLDEVEPELVELGGDGQLVLEREVDPFALAAVAERRVVDLDACHLVQFFRRAVGVSRPVRRTESVSFKTKKPSGRAGDLRAEISCRKVSANASRRAAPRRLDNGDANRGADDDNRLQSHGKRRGLKHRTSDPNYGNFKSGAFEG